MSHVAPLLGDNDNPQSKSARPLGWIARFSIATVAIIVGFLVCLVCGRLSLAGVVKSVDEPMLDVILAGAEAIPGLQRAAMTATDLGALKLDYGFAMGMALLTALALRELRVGALIVGTLFGSHIFQWATQKIVDGTVPAAELAIGGAAGPYFSGGTARVALLFGMAVTIALPWSRRNAAVAWSAATAFGVFEGLTRLVLGRHWPIDVVAGLAVGLGFLWIFRFLAGPLLADEQ